MKLQPTQKRFLVTRIEAEKATASGLILKSTDEEPRARIEAIGPQVEVSVQIGQEVLVDWSRTYKIKFEERDYYLVDQSALVAVVE